MLLENLRLNADKPEAQASASSPAIHALNSLPGKQCSPLPGLRLCQVHILAHPDASPSAQPSPLSSTGLLLPVSGSQNPGMWHWAHKAPPPRSPALGLPTPQVVPAATQGSCQRPHLFLPICILSFASIRSTVLTTLHTPSFLPLS